MTGDELIAYFENPTLAGHSFHHADHVRVAFLYLTRYTRVEALHRFSASLARFAAANGRPDRFHETVTWAFLFLIGERMARTEGTQDWAEFAAKNSDLMSWKDNILEKYYQPETLSSDLAKTTFLMPDKISSGP